MMRAMGSHWGLHTGLCDVAYLACFLLVASLHEAIGRLWQDEATGQHQHSWQASQAKRQPPSNVVCQVAGACEGFCGISGNEVCNLVSVAHLCHALQPDGNCQKYWH